jgi:hypothetical protein
MSAFQVSPDHIEAMLAAAERYGGKGHSSGRAFSFYCQGERRSFEHIDELATFGRFLWDANAASVASRYGTSASTLGEGEESEVVSRLEPNFQFSPRRQRTPTPVETLKLCICFRYQCSDWKGWETSQAAAFVNALEYCATVALPGYGAAPWEWSHQVQPVPIEAAS